MAGWNPFLAGGWLEFFSGWLESLRGWLEYTCTQTLQLPCLLIMRASDVPFLNLQLQLRVLTRQRMIR